MILTLAFGVGLEAADEKPRKLSQQMQVAIIQTQDIRTVEDLLKRGVDINAPIACGTFSPLDGAVSTQNLDMLKFLLAHGAKPRGRELADAAYGNDHQKATEIVKELLRAGVNINATNSYGVALFCAAWQNNKDLVSLLLSQPGIKIDEIGMGDYTALMHAVKNGSLELLEMLRRAGANPHLQNQRGETAITLAGKEIDKHRAIVSRLEAASNF